MNNISAPIVLKWKCWCAVMHLSFGREAAGLYVFILADAVLIITVRVWQTTAAEHGFPITDYRYRYRDTLNIKKHHLQSLTTMLKRCCVLVQYKPRPKSAVWSLRKVRNQSSLEHKCCGSYFNAWCSGLIQSLSNSKSHASLGRRT